jgi:hypothetical protein
MVISGYSLTQFVRALFLRKSLTPPNFEHFGCATRKALTQARCGNFRCRGLLFDAFAANGNILLAPSSTADTFELCRLRGADL